MTNATPQTRRTLLESATPRIGRFESLVLLAYVLGVTKESLIAFDELEVSDDEAMRFELYVETRLQGMPVPYLTGEQEFYGRYFHVTPDVLIPRPDTEVLIEQAERLMAPSGRLLDMGTGSGCLAVTLKLLRPSWNVSATDVSDKALSVAKQNAARHHADIAFYEGSWFEALPENTPPFDIIVSNPPYIAKDDEHLLQLTFEPRLALTDEADGLICLFHITEGAMEHLVPGGWLLLEHGFDQGAACQELLTSAGFTAVRTVKDYGHNDRVTMGRKPV